MRKVKERSIGIAMAALLLLLTLSVGTKVAYGATGIDTGQKCSITFDLSIDKLVLPDETQGEGEQPPLTQASPGFEELLELKTEVDLYKVADVNASGKYIAPAAGSEVSTELYNALKESLEKVSAQTTAEEWLTMAGWAMEIVDDMGNPSPAGHTTLNPASGEGMEIRDLSTGLYLIAAHDVESSQYIYSFTPYLVSLPGNDYGQEEAPDDWKYEVTVSLKPSREDRYGDLEIIKSLKTFNSTLGGADFIFSIEAEKDGVIVYSDVKSIVFDGAGTKSIKIAEQIPAGAVVTVTEVYSGASYEMISDPTQTQTIIAEETVSVSFTNDYNDGLNGGTSVVNHFVDTAAGEPDGGNGNQEERTPIWKGEQLKDSSAEPQQPEGGAAADEE